MARANVWSCECDRGILGVQGLASGRGKGLRDHAAVSSDLNETPEARSTKSTECVGRRGLRKEWLEASIHHPKPSLPPLFSFPAQSVYVPWPSCFVPLDSRST